MERASVLKCFIICRLVYYFLLMHVHKATIKTLQKIIDDFFWNKRHPFIKFKSTVGKKDEDGFGLVDLQSIITTYGIKCGLKISSPSPRIWKFYMHHHM